MKWVLIVVGLVLGKIVEEAVTRYLSVRERSRRPYEVNGYTIGPGADLRRADLFEADLEGAKADEETIWPEGFDPEAAGVTFE